MLVGTLIVATWLSWGLTWSDDRAAAVAAIVMLSVGMHAATRMSLRTLVGSAELAVAACTWTLMQPWVLSGEAFVLAYVPESRFASEAPRLLTCLVLAVPCWFVSGLMWGTLATGITHPDNSHLRRLSAFSLGIAAGLAITTFFMAPWIGAWATVAVAAAIVVAVRLISGTTVTPLQTEEAVRSIENAPGDTSMSWNSQILSPLASIAMGGLLAAAMRLAGQLMPGAAQVCCSEWIGLALGVTGGSMYFSRRRSADVGFLWPLLIPAASGAAVLALLPAIVKVELWATVTLTTSLTLMTFRFLLLALLFAPLGFGVGFVLMPSSLRDRESLRSDLPLGNLLPIAAGFSTTLYGFESLGQVGVLAICCSILGLMGLAVTLLEWKRGTLSRVGFAGAVLAAGLGLSVPAWRSHDNPALMARLLFSTSTFVAHRAGWDSKLLPMLDDARAIDVREGIHGPLTLWRSHGLELHVRENGIPRAIVSTDTEAHPQFAPEVLQAVFPIVLARQPDRVLLLGASGGVPLSTTLQFPVQQIVCVESDRHLIDVIAGPMARETGINPFADDRVQVVATPPAMAIASTPQTFDVILSSPAASSSLAGGAMFTVDHYRHASRHLSAGGIFCQRFQCVDYGPEPLRVAFQTMQQAFQEVVAIETAAGDFLLLGTNSEGMFVPDDLPQRMEAAHVRRLLARSGVDWTSLLNLPAYDHAALKEICDEKQTWTNGPANGILALRAPLDVMRWGPKLQDMQAMLTARRTSQPPFLAVSDETTAQIANQELSRKTRMLEWLGDQRVSPDLLRRLSEVATQHKLVRENPDAHWWEYRKALREQLQEHPRSAVQQVAHKAEKGTMHPEDERRKAYFTALGAAVRSPSNETLQKLASYLYPYDPMITYFARQEIADLQGRNNLNASAELRNRLHVIYFSPALDGSTRNVVAALELMINHPEAIEDPVRRYDTMNGLLQTLRSRWETRQGHPAKSVRRQITDVDRSIVIVDKTVQALDELHDIADVSDTDWEHRKQVIDRMLQRPLHTYRTQLEAASKHNEAKTQLMLNAAERIKEAADADHESTESAL
jgi:hypothetical protein